MTNDVSGVNLEEAVPCIALSKNDSYVMSAAGGKVSLFNMMTFKVLIRRFANCAKCYCFWRYLSWVIRLCLIQVMTTFMPPPPASTFLAFHPLDNNIIAIGMEDSTIHIYNVRVDEASIYDADRLFLYPSFPGSFKFILSHFSSGEIKAERAPEAHKWFSFFNCS